MKRTIYHQLWVLSAPPPVFSRETSSCYMELDGIITFLVLSFSSPLLPYLFFPSRFLYARHPLILYWSHISNFLSILWLHGRGSPYCHIQSMVLTKDRYGTTRPTEDGQAQYAWQSSVSVDSSFLSKTSDSTSRDVIWGFSECSRSVLCVFS